MAKKYKFISDPAHGWLEVPLRELRELGIQDKITPYSYCKGEMAYLEEDSDAGKFITALEEKEGKKFNPHVLEDDRIVQIISDGSSVVRSYPPYSAQGCGGSYEVRHRLRRF